MHSTSPFGGGSRRNTEVPFGTEKLEWCGYQRWKKFVDKFRHFDRIPVCARRTDRHLATKWSAVKTILTKNRRIHATPERETCMFHVPQPAQSQSLLQRVVATRPVRLYSSRLLRTFVLSHVRQLSFQFWFVKLEWHPLCYWAVSKLFNSFNPLEWTRNYSATSNNMKFVHWSLMGGLLHLVQWGWDWAWPQPAQAPPRCTKCNSPPINDQCTNRRIDKCAS